MGYSSTQKYKSDCCAEGRISHRIHVTATSCAKGVGDDTPELPSCHIYLYRQLDSQRNPLPCTHL